VPRTAWHDVKEVGVAMTTRLIRVCLPSLISLLGSTACIDPGTLNPASDVPCLAPDAWPREAGLSLTRPEGKATDILLITYQTWEQSREDDRDGVLGNGPHGAVYRFDPAQLSFALVEDTAWDDTDSDVTIIWSQPHRESPFRIDISRDLVFNERDVPVAGGTPMFALEAPYSPVTAVLSTDGIPPIPFLVPPVAGGQHYHQLFSELSGDPLGPPVRLGVGARRTLWGWEKAGVVRMDWTTDEKYVLYEQPRSGATGIRELCVVSVADEIAGIEGE